MDRVLFVGDGLVHARIEEVALTADPLEALLLKDMLQLLADQRDALRPGVLGDVIGHAGERALKIVEDGQKLGQQAGVRIADRLVDLLACPSLVIREVGLGALGQIEVGVGLAALLLTNGARVCELCLG
jgi:hypothetical protein